MIFEPLQPPHDITEILLKVALNTINQTNRNPANKPLHRFNSGICLERIF